MIQKLLREAKRVLTILPGSGINPDTVGTLLDSLGSYGVKEIHLSAGEWVSGEMSFRRDGMGMGIEGPVAHLCTQWLTYILNMKMR